MRDNEIIKALTYCVDASLCDSQDCPFYRMHREETECCVDVALRQALSLINRQQAEIERLQGRLADLEHYIEESEKDDIIFGDKRNENL